MAVLLVTAAFAAWFLMGLWYAGRTMPVRKFHLEDGQRVVFVADPGAYAVCRQREDWHSVEVYSVDSSAWWPRDTARPGGDL